MFQLNIFEQFTFKCHQIICHLWSIRISYVLLFLYFLAWSLAVEEIHKICMLQLFYCTKNRSFKLWRRVSAAGNSSDYFWRTTNTTAKAQSDTTTKCIIILYVQRRETWEPNTIESSPTVTHRGCCFSYVFGELPTTAHRVNKYAGNLRTNKFFHYYYYYRMPRWVVFCIDDFVLEVCHFSQYSNQSGLCETSVGGDPSRRTVQITEECVTFNYAFGTD